MRRVLPLLVAALLAVGAASAAAAATARAPSCRWAADWQRLADRIDAPVYCPGWLPDPLTGDIGGRWNNIDSVDRDRSYLIGFVWQEVGSGELHVNLRGYPGRTRIPTCRIPPEGKTPARAVPCFSDARGTKRFGPLRVTMFTVNQDADAWHVLYAWRYRGSLYTISEHVAVPLTFGKVVRNLDLMMRRLVLVKPSR